MVFGMKLVFANLWLFKPLLIKLMPLISPPGAAMLHTTVAFTMGEGADGLNVLPQEAYVTANLRFIPISPRMRASPSSPTWRRNSTWKPKCFTRTIPARWWITEETPSGWWSGPSARSIPGVGVSPYVMTGGTDAKYYKDVCDDCIRFAPLYINKQQYESIHGLNENIYIGTPAHGRGLL